MTSEKIDVVSFLSGNTKNFNNFLTTPESCSRLLEYKGLLPSKDIEPYEWPNYAESQQKEVIRYLEKHLVPKLPSEIMMLNVADDKEFLDILKKKYNLCTL